MSSCRSCLGWSSCKAGLDWSSCGVKVWSSPLDTRLACSALSTSPLTLESGRTRNVMDRWVSAACRD